MRCFSIDLSSRVASVAIIDDNTTIVQENWNQGDVPRQHVFALLSRLFKSSDTEVTSIDQFVVGLGPGSFSGIRTAIAAVIGLALPDEKPVGGIASAESLAWDVLRKFQRPEAVIIGDARRQRLWAARYRCDDEDVRCSMECSLFTHQEFMQRCLDTDLLASPEFERLADFFREIADSGPEIIGESQYPRAESIAQIALTRISNNIPLDPPQPLYLHPPVFMKPRGDKADIPTLSDSG